MELKWVTYSMCEFNGIPYKLNKLIPFKLKLSFLIIGSVHGEEDCFYVPGKVLS